MQGFKLLWSKANGRSLFDHRSDRVYMYLYAGCVTLTLTLTLIRRLKFTYGEYIQVRRKFIYTYVYIRYVYIRRIYTYTVWANPNNTPTPYDPSLNVVLCLNAFAMVKPFFLNDTRIFETPTSTNQGYQ